MAIGLSRSEYWQQMYDMGKEVFETVMPDLDDVATDRLAKMYADHKTEQLFGRHGAETRPD